MHMRWILIIVASVCPLTSSASTVLYQHGEPSDYEQLMLELINRARANPRAEATRYGIDLNQGLSPGTIQDTPKQPLAFNSSLISSARAHSQWMLNTGTFSHTGSGGSSAGDRMTTAGYVFTGAWTWGENIAYGGGVGAVDLTTQAYDRHQSLFLSAGHRENICSAQFEDVGLGLLAGTFGGNNVGMVTENFAASASTPSPQVLGVVYYDFDSDGAYDSGEGVRGVRVDMPGSTYYANTSTSGGYALPIGGLTGARTVSFGGDATNVAVGATFDGSSNKKVDLSMSYSLPAITGSATPVAGRENVYTLPFVPWATGIDVQIGTRSPASSDSADDLTKVTKSTTGTYSPLSATIKYSGSNSYHLATATGLSDQTLTYNTAFFAKPGASISFWSRLRYASTTQKARVQISTDNGASWISVFELAGNGGDTESAFVTRTASLSPYEGRKLLLRFSYVHTSSTYFYQTSDLAGWFVDLVTFNNLDTLTETVSSQPNGGTFSFTPVTGQNYVLAAIPRHYERSWPAGTSKQISGVSPSGFLLWADLSEDAAGLTRGAIGNHADGDINNDGVPNLVAYALGLGATTNSSQLLPRLAADATMVHFEYWKDTAKTDVRVTPLVSVNLDTWKAPDASEFAYALSDTYLRSEGSIERRRLSISRILAPRVFFRLNVSPQ